MDFKNFYNDDCTAALKIRPNILPDEGDGCLLFSQSPDPASAKGKSLKGLPSAACGAIDLFHRPNRLARREACDRQSVTVHSKRRAVARRPVHRRRRVRSRADHVQPDQQFLRTIHQRLFSCKQQLPRRGMSENATNCMGKVSVEQGAFQVFANFFNGTKAGYLFKGPPPPRQFSSKRPFSLSTSNGGT